jgi:amidohydrolase
MRSMPSENLSDLLDLAEPAMVAIRHDLHAHPELSFAEYRTSEVIGERLSELGWRVEDCPTETGAVARLSGRPGRHVMIRADIDALPVTEETDLDFASETPGVMHACGHDVHTAAALGAADVLARLNDAGELVGTFTLVFQPAEEGLGGARTMLERGLFERRAIDYVIGAHVSSLAPVGVVASRAGIVMSEVHSFSILLEGTGGHGAMASAAGNVVLAVSSLPSRLGEVVAGLSYEGTDCSCAAGVINAGSAPNVVPRRASLSGTLRTFTPSQSDEALSRLEALVASTARDYEVHTRLVLAESAPAVVNDPGVMAIVEDALALSSDLTYLEMAPVTPSDDVSEFLARVPGCYLFVGGSPLSGARGMHHSPDFVVLDESCRVFAEVLTRGALALAAS